MYANMEGFHRDSHIPTYVKTFSCKIYCYSRLNTILILEYNTVG